MEFISPRTEFHHGASIGDRSLYFGTVCSVCTAALPHHSCCRASLTLVQLLQDQLLVLVTEGLPDHAQEVGSGEGGELLGDGGRHDRALRHGRGGVCHPAHV